MVDPLVFMVLWFWFKLVWPWLPRFIVLCSFFVDVGFPDHVAFALHGFLVRLLLWLEVAAFARNGFSYLLFLVLSSS
ncbi:hypothetical protein A2U01_0012999 [Trifolium medium]|uniref:Uncharacterized protein n=1 Tax=Trifolium medium TaxID=97028 RepID=A0A392MX17_9FABA|nr:hypothetical protein [Trifolium medium]